MHLNFDAFLFTLPYMLKGMVGIFCITLIIIVSIWLLNKLVVVKKTRVAKKQQ